MQGENEPKIRGDARGRRFPVVRTKECKWGKEEKSKRLPGGVFSFHNGWRDPPPPFRTHTPLLSEIHPASKPRHHSSS
jgi:hypothetical protein